MKIPVEITPTHGPGPFSRRQEPVTFGVPIPRGQGRSADGWTIGAAGAPASAVDATVLDRWPDGTARWVLVDAQVTADGTTSGWSLNTDGPQASRRLARTLDINGGI